MMFHERDEEFVSCGIPGGKKGFVRMNDEG